MRAGGRACALGRTDGQAGGRAGMRADLRAGGRAGGLAGVRAGWRSGGHAGWLFAIYLLGGLKREVPHLFSLVTPRGGARTSARAMAFSLAPLFFLDPEDKAAGTPSIRPRTRY